MRPQLTPIGNAQERAAEDAYLGDLGPIFRATVGDTINVTFLNRIERALSVHPHGVFYTKANEGALYADSTSGAFSRQCSSHGSSLSPVLSPTSSEAYKGSARSEASHRITACKAVPWPAALNCILFNVSPAVTRRSCAVEREMLACMQALTSRMTQ